MGNENKEQEFLNLFDAHVDGLFSHCLSRIGNPAQAHELIEKTFKRGWDQIVLGRQPQIRELYRLIDELINATVSARGLPFPSFFSYFTTRVTHFS